MSTNQRKDKRRRALLAAGQRALEIEATARTEKEASDRALAKALETIEAKDVEIHDLLAKIAEGNAAIERGIAVIEGLRACSDHTDELAGDGCLVCELSSMARAFEGSEEIVADLKERLTKAELRIAELEALDKDSAKLRRRLREAKEELHNLHQKANREKQAEVF
jgi:DNA repair exonuclease SbcCD ATPase subunit